MVDSQNFLENENRAQLVKMIKNNNQVQVLRQYLEGSTDINYQDEFGKTPLIQACESRYENIVKFLIGEGVNLNKKDKNGYSVLWRHKVGSEKNKLSAKAAQQIRVGPSEPVLQEQASNNHKLLW